MNANELADEIKKERETSEYLTPVDQRRLFRYEKMIRQQQDEIAQLKHMNRNWQISEYQLQVEIDALKSNYESMAQTNIAMGKRLLELNEENRDLAGYIKKDLKMIRLKALIHGFIDGLGFGFFWRWLKK